MAARDLLVLVAADIEDGIDQRNPSIPERAVVCEWHEDWIVVDGTDQELVSAKHRDPDQGAWDLSTLTTDGGLAHLYRTSHSLPIPPKGRIVSNQTLHKEKDHGLGNLCIISDHASGSPITRPSAEKTLSTVHHVARHLLHASDKAGLTGPLAQGRTKRAEHCHPCDELKSQVHTFLALLTLDMPKPARSEIDTIGPHDYVGPILKSLGHPIAAAPDVWHHLVGYIERHMRARGNSKWGSLTESVIRLRAVPTAADLPADLQRRRITSTQARSLIDQVASNTRRRSPLPPAPYRTVAAVKMSEGGCTPTAIETAEENLTRWEQAISAEMDDSPGLHAELLTFDEELGLHLQDLHHDVQSSATQGQSYGSELWQKATMLPLDEMPQPPFKMTRGLLVGAITARTNSCRFWLSNERFDAHAVLRAANETYVDAQQTTSGHEEGGA